jgi:hypothetical protein
MRFDARLDRDPKARADFIEWLVSEAASGLKRAGGTEAIKGVVFLYLSRAYEAQLEPDLICELLGVADGSALHRAGLSKADERAAMDAYEALDPILKLQYREK